MANLQIPAGATVKAGTQTFGPYSPGAGFTNIEFRLDITNQVDPFTIAPSISYDAGATWNDWPPQTCNGPFVSPRTGLLVTTFSMVESTGQPTTNQTRLQATVTNPTAFPVGPTGGALSMS